MATKPTVMIHWVDHINKPVMVEKCVQKTCDFLCLWLNRSLYLEYGHGLSSLLLQQSSTPSRDFYYTCISNTTAFQMPQYFNYCDNSISYSSVQLRRYIVIILKHYQHYSPSYSGLLKSFLSMTTYTIRMHYILYIIINAIYVHMYVNYSYKIMRNCWYFEADDIPCFKELVEDISQHIKLLLKQKKPLNFILVQHI